VHLPDMSGVELVREVRQRLPTLPVIFATGDRKVSEMDGLENTALITKPYDYETLASQIRSMASARG
jgi:DNA-binding response OmpR family regulator